MFHVRSDHAIEIMHEQSRFVTLVVNLQRERALLIGYDLIKSNSSPAVHPGKCGIIPEPSTEQGIRSGILLRTDH